MFRAWKFAKFALSLLLFDLALEWDGSITYISALVDTILDEQIPIGEANSDMWPECLWSKECKYIINGTLRSRLTLGSNRAVFPPCLANNWNTLSRMLTRLGAETMSWYTILPLTSSLPRQTILTLLDWIFSFRAIWSTWPIVMPAAARTPNSGGEMTVICDSPRWNGDLVSKRWDTLCA